MNHQLIDWMRSQGAASVSRHQTAERVGRVLHANPAWRVSSRGQHSWCLDIVRERARFEVEVIDEEVVHLWRPSFSRLPYEVAIFARGQEAAALEQPEDLAVIACEGGALRWVSGPAGAEASGLLERLPAALAAQVSALGPQGFACIQRGGVRLGPLAPTREAIEALIPLARALELSARVV